MNRLLVMTVALCALLGASLAQASLHSVLPRDAVMRMVVEEAVRADFPPELALAVAEVESAFSTHALSSAGARGVMQIMPRTGREVFGLSPRQLYDARTSIRAGIAFLADLQERYGRLDIALSHYNGGSAVRQRDGRLRVIPATRAYVDRVLLKQRQYRSHRLVVAARAGDLPGRGLARPEAPAQLLAELDEARAATVRRLRALTQRNIRRAGPAARNLAPLTGAERTLAPADAEADASFVDPLVADIRRWEAFR